MQLRRVSSKTFKNESYDPNNNNLRISSSDAQNTKNVFKSETKKNDDQDNKQRFKELTVKTKWNAINSSPEGKGNLRNPSEQKLLKGVSFKEDTVLSDIPSQLKKSKTEATKDQELKIADQPLGSPKVGQSLT